MKRKLLAILLVTAMVAGLLPLTASTVYAVDAANIAITVSEYNHEHLGSGKLNATVVGDNTVNITGTVSNALNPLTLIIDAGVTVTWNATLTGENERMVWVYGDGKFQMESGLIHSTEGIALFSGTEIASLTISGGKISSEIDSAILTEGSKTSVRINGGIVCAGLDADGSRVGSKNVSAISTEGSQSTVEVNGGVVFGCGWSVVGGEGSVISMRSGSPKIVSPGVVILWNKARNTYIDKTEVDIFHEPANASTFWGKTAGGAIGIDYTSGSATGFFPIKGIKLDPNVGMGIDKEEFAPGETIPVSLWDNAATDWVALAVLGSDYSDTVEAKRADKSTTVINLTAPAKLGDYEVRRHTGYPFTANNIENRIAFKVYTPVIMSLDYSVFLHGAKISVGLQNHIPGYWVMLAKKGAAYDNTIEGIKPGDSPARFELTAPAETGDYEVRLHCGYPVAESNYMFAISIRVTDDVTDKELSTAQDKDDLTGNSRARFTVTAIDSGVLLRWSEQGAGKLFRVYRSTTPGEEGISITDFAMTTTTCVDVNVKPKTTYYYTLRQVLAEANPWAGKPEELGPPIGGVQTVTTKDVLLEPEPIEPIESDPDKPKPGDPDKEMIKHYILMKVGNHMMIVDTEEKLIDPDYPEKKVAPEIRNDRTILPIRAIIEEIGGKVGWDGATKKITLTVGSRTIDMWVDETKLVINGVESVMDVAPIVINDRTMVPVRFAAESSGCTVEWLNLTQEIVITFYLPPDTN